MSTVATICFMHFRCMLHMFYLDVAKVDLVLHMLQRLYTYIASVCFKCLSYFQMYVASGLSVCCICCTGYTRMLQVYVFKCFSCFKRKLQVFYLNVAYVAVAIYVCCKLSVFCRLTSRFK